MSSYDQHSSTISVDDRAGVRVIALGGEHDLSTVAQFAVACAGPAMPTVVDLTAATFIDSSVIGELVAAFDANADYGFVVAANPNSDVERTLSACLLETIMPVIDDLAEATRLAQPARSRLSA